MDQDSIFFVKLPKFAQNQKFCQTTIIFTEADSFFS